MGADWTSPLKSGPSLQSVPSLPSLLVGLLPGGDGWPCAADLDLEPAIAALAEALPQAEAALAALGERALPPRSDPDGLERALTELQASEPAVFGSLMTLAYGAYYAHPDVLAVIEDRCGYPARPPMPAGHPVRLDGPDPSPATAGTAPTWRSDGTDIADRVRDMQQADPQRIWTQEEISSWRTS